jgi:mannosyl-oligosaccharide alpha-1,2-mannosidase
MPWPFTMSSLLSLVTLQVENTIKQLRLSFPKDGLLPIYISPDSGQPTIGKVTFGAMGDSFYEYLLKVWIQGNKTEVVKHYREMWELSMEGMRGLISKSSPSGYTFIAERTGASMFNKVPNNESTVPADSDCLARLR